MDWIDWIVATSLDVAWVYLYWSISGSICKRTIASFRWHSVYVYLDWIGLDWIGSNVLMIPLAVNRTRTLLQ